MKEMDYREVRRMGRGGGLFRGRKGWIYGSEKKMRRNVKEK